MRSGIAILVLAACREPHPGAAEPCETDAWFADNDGDGFAAPDARPRTECGAEGSTDKTDCDDADPAIYPHADEICGDRVRQDCAVGASGCPYTGDVALRDVDVAIVGPWFESMTGLEQTFAGVPSRRAVLVSGYLAPVDGTGHAGRAYLLTNLDDRIVDLARTEPVIEGSEEHDIVGGAVDDGSGLIRDRADGVFVTRKWSPLLIDDSGRVRAELSPGLGAGDLLAVGDVTGDGARDLVFGNAPPTEDTYVFEGPLEGTIEADHAWAVWTTASESALGRVVANGNDIDGDGNPDVLLGDVNHGSHWTGAVFVVNDPVPGIAPVEDVFSAEILGGGEYEYAGQYLHDARDIDGDGYSDVFMCTYSADWSDTGLQPIAGRVVYGPVTGTIRPEDDDAVFTSQVGDGGACAIVGDVDGDQYEDLVIGAETLTGSDGGEAGGGAYLFHGPVLGTVDVATASATFRDVSGAFAGWEIEPAGDLDDNGLADFLIGAPSAFGGNGAVYVVLGGGGF